MISTLRKLFTPAPLSEAEHRRVMNLLRKIATHGGFLDEQHPEFDMWSEEIRLASRHGWATPGSAFMTGVSLTQRGVKALAAI